jgi:putative ATPase
MQCLPENLKDRTYYHPTNEGIEKRIRDRMEEIKRLRLQGNIHPRPAENPES